MSRRVEIQVGIAVLAALAILVLGVTWLKEFSLERRVRTWHVVFLQTGGLGASDEVQVNGLRKGAVKSMKLVGDQVVVDLGLSSEIQLTTDSRVAIRNVGMMGEKVIAVDLKVTGHPYTPLDTIRGIYEKGIPEVMAELGGAVEGMTALTDQLRAMGDVMQKDGNFAKTLSNFRETSEELRAMVKENRTGLKSTLENFAAASRTAKGLTADREAELSRALDQFAAAANNMSVLSSRLDSLRATLQSVSGRVERGEGTLGRLVQDDKLYTDLNSTVQSLKALIEDVKRNPKKYFKLEIF